MAYDEQLAERIRDEIGQHPTLVEKQMFGGLSFLVAGNMAVGVIGDDLCVRVGKEGHQEAIDQPGAKVFDFTGPSMKGWVLVAPGALESQDDLAVWIDRGVRFASSLPAK